MLDKLILIVEADREHVEGFAYFNDKFIPAENQFTGAASFVERLRVLLQSSDSVVAEGWTANEMAERFAALVILMQLYRCPWVSGFTAARVQALVSAWPW